MEFGNETKKRKVENSKEDKEIGRESETRHLLKHSAQLRKGTGRVSSSFSSVRAVCKKSGEYRSARAGLNERVHSEDLTTPICRHRKSSNGLTRTQKEDSQLEANSQTGSLQYSSGGYYESFLKQGDSDLEFRNKNANASCSKSSKLRKAKQSGPEKKSQVELDALERLREIEVELHEKGGKYLDQSIHEIEMEDLGIPDALIYNVTWKHSDDIKYVPTSVDDVNNEWALFREVNSNIPLQGRFGNI